MKTEEEIRSQLSLVYSQRDILAAESARGELADPSLLHDIWGKIYALRWALGENIQWGACSKPQEQGEGSFKEYPLMSYCWPGCQVPTAPVALEVGQEHYPPLVSTEKVQAVVVFNLDRAAAFSEYARKKDGITVLSEREDWAFDDEKQEGPPVVRFAVAADSADNLFWLGLHFERSWMLGSSLDSLTLEEQQALTTARQNPNSLQAIAELRKLATPGFWQPSDQGMVAVVSYEQDDETQSSAKLVPLSIQNQHYICRLHNVLPRFEAQLATSETALADYKTKVAAELRKLMLHSIHPGFDSDSRDEEDFIKAENYVEQLADALGVSTGPTDAEKAQWEAERVARKGEAK